jgi:hypothetical protein
MQVHHGADRRFVGFSPVNGVVHGQEMFAGESIHPFHQQCFTGPRLECRAWGGGTKAPELRRRKIAVNFAGDGASLDSIKRNTQLLIFRAGPISLGLRYFGNWEPIHKLRQSVDIQSSGHASHGAPGIGVGSCVEKPALSSRQGCSQQTRLLQEISASNHHIPSRQGYNNGKAGER